MNLFIVNDSSDQSPIGIRLRQELTLFLQQKGHQVKEYSIDVNEMHYCIGCFSCWIKTPGECIYKDISRDINRDYVNSDIAVMISPLRYGCYSPAIRRMLDRLLPNILPFFKKINGEMHHAPRYDKYPRFTAIGYGEDITNEEASTFASLSEANAVNFQSGHAKTFVVRMESDLSKLFEAFEDYVKGCESK